MARVSDLAAVTASTSGKVELDTLDDSDNDQVLDKIVRNACSNVFRRHFSATELADLVQRFDQGGFTVEVGPLMTCLLYTSRARTHARRKSIMSAVAVPCSTRSLTSRPVVMKRRMVSVGPFSEIGGMTTWIRDPSSSRASTIGELSSMRRPTRLTMRSMTCISWSAVSNRYGVLSLIHI